MWCYRGVVGRVWCIRFMVRKVGGSSLLKSGSNCSTTNYRHEWHLIASRIVPTMTLKCHWKVLVLMVQWHLQVSLTLFLMALDSATNNIYRDIKMSLKVFSHDGAVALASIYRGTRIYHGTERSGTYTKCHKTKKCH